MREIRRFLKKKFNWGSGEESEVWPSRGVHLRCVKQVHSVLISYGHQVLRHLREHKNWDWEKQTADKFQLPRGRSWRALLREDNTDNISPSYSSLKACHTYSCDREHWDLFTVRRTVLHKNQTSEGVRESISHTNTQRENAHFIRDLRSKCHPGAWTRRERERQTDGFYLRVWSWAEYFPAFIPTYLTRDRKHVGPIFPGSYRKGKNQEVRWEMPVKRTHTQNVWAVGIYLDIQSSNTVSKMYACEWWAILSRETLWLSSDETKRYLSGV